MHKFVTKTRVLNLLGLILTLFSLSGCGVFLKSPEITPRTALEKLTFSRYPAFSDHLAYKDLGIGIERSLDYLHRLPADREFFFGKDIYTTAHLIVSLEIFLNS